MAIIVALFSASAKAGILDSPYGKISDICVSIDGQPKLVNGYPSTPYVITPFQDVVTNPVNAVPVDKKCRDDGHCVFAYEFDIVNVQARPFDNSINGCKIQPATNFLTYGGTIPAPTITMPVGHESLVRFNNKVDTSGYYSGTHAPCVGTRSGRPFSVHFHGSASLAPFDGWAEDETCGGETKDYIYPNNRPNTGWYHDHALHVTADNAYHGTAGFYVTSAKKTATGCGGGEPYGLENMEERLMILGDRLLDNQCQNRMEPNGAHDFSFYGDVNSINGVPFPIMNMDAKWIRMRILSASISRPFLLKIKTESGSEISAKICKIVASDGGYLSSAAAFPTTGLLASVADRWEVVCDFSAYAGKTLYLTNERDDRTKNAPMFCYSHLVAKLNIGAKPAVSAVFNAAMTPATTGTLIPITQALSSSDLATATTMINKGQFHRRMDFGRSNGVWTINGETWDSFKIAAADVGHNTWEIWQFRTGGGWFHPIHMHLVDFYVMRRDGSTGVQAYERMAPKDVFFLGEGNTVYVLVRFGAHKGDYMFHCHNLIHEDNDMLRAFKVVDSKMGMTASTANQYVANPLNSIIYSNYAYADPMYSAVAATPSTTAPSLTDALTNAVNANVYRIFYPLPADKVNYGSYWNPWESQWCANNA